MNLSNRFFRIAAILMFIFLGVSCSKEDKKEIEEPEVVVVDPIENNDSLQNENIKKRISSASVGEFSNSQPYALNIVYFIPADLSPYPNFQKRLSDLMLWTQKWFKDQMEANGYPNTTFGLFTSADKKNVRFNIIFGTKGKASYEYNGGSGNIMTEVNSFFATNPSLKTGAHTLIILPAFDIQASGEPGGGTMGPPFYGIGKECFALDYPDLDIKYLGQNTSVLDKSFVTWFGGLVHELGHGLNLPHNRQKVSEGNNPNQGMSLMWAGNSTLGISPTFLTGIDAAILNNNQIFSKVSGTFYDNVQATITSIKGYYDTTKASIILKGKFQSNKSVSNILIYNDPNVNNEGAGANKDYNAIGWAAKPIGQDSFYVEMPVAELAERAEGMQYECKVKLLHSNGVVYEKTYNYSIENGIPNIDVGNKTYLAKTGWSILDFSSQEISSSYPGQAIRIIDDKLDTYWHSNWSVQPASSHPHRISIDTKAVKTVEGVTLWQRQDSGDAGRSKDIELWTSIDGTNWTKSKDALLISTAAEQTINFNQSISLRYIRIVVNSSYGSTEEKNCSIAEISLF